MENPNSNSEQIQQGDINFFPPTESLPVGAKRCKDKILAYGEATGHTHAVITPEAEVWEYAGQKFIVLPEGVEEAQVQHPTHHTQTVRAIGTRRVIPVGRTYEYDHFAEESREVSD